MTFNGEQHDYSQDESGVGEAAGVAVVVGCGSPFTSAFIAGSKVAAVI